MNRLGGTNVAKKIGTWCSNWELTLFQQLSEVRMIWTSYSDKASLSSYDDWQYVKVCFQNYSKRTGPKGFCKDLKIHFLLFAYLYVFEGIMRL